MKATKATTFGIALAACGLILAGMGSAQAQVAGSARRGRLAGRAGGRMGGQQGGQLGKLLQQLNLSADQKQQIKSISMAARQQAKTIEQNTTLSAADKKTQVKAVHKDAHAKIMAVLTPDQKAKLKELIKAARAQKKGAAAGTTPIRPGASQGTPSPSTPGASASAPSNTTSTVSTVAEKDDDILDLLDDPA